mmetsp:Transcript_30045/g.77096  ORF Transcript_30045/g.77096 Transcript_30045/m.77096 type:complete len:312 (-) Transcript_30045:1542-2477(-)
MNTKAELLQEIKRNAYRLPIASSAVSLHTTAWGEENWLQAFESLFLHGAQQSGDKRHQDDDLLFFVWKEQAAVDREEPFTVRRWCHSLPDVITAQSADIDWYKTTFLNLIVHASFELTLAVCKHGPPGSGSLADPIIQAKTRVYASPTHSGLTINQAEKAAQQGSPEPCWPQISFAVMNFEEEFDSLVVPEADACFCVILAVRSCDFLSCCTPGTSTPTSTMPGAVAFSGLVTHPQLQGAMRSGNGVLSFIFGEPKVKKVLMRGPSGQGVAEVAVTKLKQSLSGGTMPMRCCLMSLSLPWEAVAASILRTI